jgi:hypothetical protein
MMGVLYEKRENCRFKSSPQKCSADMRKKLEALGKHK